MNQFFSDSIHMTEGEFLLEYWWFWLAVVVLIFGGWIAFFKFVSKEDKSIRTKY